MIFKCAFDPDEIEIEKGDIFFCCHKTILRGVTFEVIELLPEKLENQIRIRLVCEAVKIYPPPIIKLLPKDEFIVHVQNLYGLIKIGEKGKIYPQPIIVD